MKLPNYVTKGERLHATTEIKPGIVLAEFRVGTRGIVPRYALLKYLPSTHPMRLLCGEIKRPSYGSRTMEYCDSRIGVQLTVDADGVDFLVEQLKFYAERFS